MWGDGVPVLLGAMCMVGVLHVNGICATACELGVQAVAMVGTMPVHLRVLCGAGIVLGAMCMAGVLHADEIHVNA